MQVNPERAAGLARLQEFIPHAGETYAGRRNFDVAETSVSGLSPYLRYRLISEAEVIRETLKHHDYSQSGKFIQEVFWRVYWKGWLEQRAMIWSQYQAGVNAALNRVQTEAGLRMDFEAACLGKTDIECFNFWAQDIVKNGYLHNHARMWFASIWIFTLHLPWELGANFFMRHLLDGDPASNTLSWRWVAGLQTIGKAYLATPENIARFTEGHFNPLPGELATKAVPPDGPAHPERSDIPTGGTLRSGLRTGLLLTEDDIQHGEILGKHIAPICVATVNTTHLRSPLCVCANVENFTRHVLQNAAPTACAIERTNHQDQSRSLVEWARAAALQQIATPYAPVGPVADMLNILEPQLGKHGIDLVRVMRDFDRICWPHATAGYFKFRKQIPTLIETLRLAAT